MEDEDEVMSAQQEPVGQSSSSSSSSSNVQQVPAPSEEDASGKISNEYDQNQQNQLDRMSQQARDELNRMSYAESAFNNDDGGIDLNTRNLERIHVAEE